MHLDQIVSCDSQVMNGSLFIAGPPVPAKILIQHLTAGDSLDILTVAF